MICRDLHHFDDVLLRLKASAFTPGRENADRLLTFVAELRDIRQCAVPSFFCPKNKSEQWMHGFTWIGDEQPKPQAFD